MSYPPGMLIGRLVVADAPLQCWWRQFIPVMRPRAGRGNPVYGEFINLVWFFFLNLVSKALFSAFNNLISFEE